MRYREKGGVPGSGTDRKQQIGVSPSAPRAVLKLVSSSSAADAGASVRFVQFLTCSESGQGSLLFCCSSALAVVVLCVLVIGSYARYTFAPSSSLALVFFPLRCDRTIFEKNNLKQNETYRVCLESAEGVSYLWNDVARTQQQRPESPTVLLPGLRVTRYIRSLDIYTLALPLCLKSYSHVGFCRLDFFAFTYA